MSNVNSPKHYVIEVDGVKIECLQIIEALGLDKDLYLGSAFQYLFRAGRKGDNKKLEDLQKCVFYIQKAIEAEQYPQKSTLGKSINHMWVCGVKNCITCESLYGAK